MAEQVPIGFPEIIASLRERFWFLNPHYEAAWTDSWSHRRCLHAHGALIEAAKCAMPHGAGWYVFAVENGRPRELTDAEDKVVNEFRFGQHFGREASGTDVIADSSLVPGGKKPEGRV